MNSVVYNGNVVNTAISDISRLQDQFSSLSTSIKQATNKIVSARGFNEYIGGITSDSFSDYVGECGNAVGEFISLVRQKQVSILAYSENKDDINAFLDSLSNADYKNLDLSELEKYISLDRKACNFFKGLGADIATVGLGLVEGVMDFGETAADLVTIGGSLFASIFTKGYDLITGSDVTTQLWNETKATVSEKKVESLFNNFYSDTAIGRDIKNNFSLSLPIVGDVGFDTVRGISKGLGYTAGMIGANVVTGGLASGLGVGAAGSIGAGQLAATAGIMGFSNGAEEAWADGATTGKGLLYGAATGVWEGTQWYLGAKINQYGGLGDRVASGIFKGAASGVGTRIAMDTVDSGLEGFVQPALSMIYKDYGGSSFQENYAKAFEAAGGWGNVASQAVMGAFASAIGEFSGARKLLKEEAKQADIEEARKVFASALEGEEGAVAMRELAGMGDGFLDADMDASGFTRSRNKTIDGEYIRSGDTKFNTKTGTNIPSDYKWFMDGAYIPDDAVGARGIFKQYESNLKASEVLDLIEQNRSKLSGADYTALVKAAQIFEEAGEGVNLNELKLIVNHSEGNVGRIKSALMMSYTDASEDAMDGLALKLAKELFPSSDLTQGGALRRQLVDDYIDSLRSSSKDSWQSSAQILSSIDSDQLIRTLGADAATDRLARVNQYFQGGISAETAWKLASSDGYPSTIRSILLEDGTIPENLLDTLSVGGASKIFQTSNLARLKAMYEIDRFNFDKALQLTTTSGASFDGYSDLLKAANLFSSSGTRRTYYAIIDDLVESGVSLRDATMQAKLMNANAVTSLGMDAPQISISNASLFTAEDTIFHWNKGIIDTFDNSAGSVEVPDYIRKNYVTADHKVDAKKLTEDFSSLMQRKIGEMDATKMGLQGLDYNYSKKASDLFLSSYLEAATDVNNPNRAEALRFMSKMLELDSQGKQIFVTNNAGRTGSHFDNRSTINLAISTVDGEHVGTVFHENGHFVFGNVLDARYPSDFETVRRAAVSNLDSASSQSLLRYYAENTDELRSYVGYLADKELDSVLRKNGFSGIEGYQQYLVDKYSQMSVSSRSSYLGDSGTRSGSYTYDSYRGIQNRMDFKSAENCANMQLNSMRSKIYDNIYRTQFADYEVTSGIIDSVSKGKVRYSYGHGEEYFAVRRDSNGASYHELVADYSSMKVTGNNKAIRFLRYVLGDQLIDMVDNTYQQMLK